MSHHTNIVRIKAVANLLNQLKEEFVFVGGATVSLYGDETRGEARPTEDVDVIIELAAYSGYAALDEKLRNYGFVNDIESGVICRYKIQGFIVDIMPTDASIIGFTNRWYADGFKNAITIQLDDYLIKIFSLPYFIASKIEAFKSRGNNNYLYSTDFEDIVYVFENSANILTLINESPKKVNEYLKEAFSEFRKDSLFEEGISAHVEPNTKAQQIMRINSIVKEFLGDV
jgi:predicted nucleotidyltransferase